MLKAEEVDPGAIIRSLASRIAKREINYKIQALVEGGLRDECKMCTKRWVLKEIYRLCAGYERRERAVVMSMVQRSYRGGVGQPYEASRRELLERNKGYSA